MGIRSCFLFGNTQLPLLPRAHPFGWRLGTAQSTGGLALVGMCYINIFLGPDTTPGSPGTSLGTLSSPTEGGGNDRVIACATGKHLLSYVVDLFY